MLIWCSILFLLGVLAFFDSIFNMGDIFRQINSVLFMLLSLGLFLRTTTKKKLKKLESFESENFNLKRKIQTLESSQERLSKY